MNPLVLAGILGSLVVIPLVVIGLFTLVGLIFSAPRRFGSILFVVLFLAALGGAAFGYFRAGEVSVATVTSTSERVVVDDHLRARHEFTLTVDVPGSGSKRIDVPARIYDQAATIGAQLKVRTGSLLGIQLARAEREGLGDLIPLGSLGCAIGVVLVTAIAASARKARAPAVLVVLALLAGTGVQPALNGLGPRSASAQVAATQTGSTPVGSSRAPAIPALGYLRGPFSIDQRWMWSSHQPLRFVAVTFVPAGRTTPVTAVDVVPASSAGPDGQQVQLRYRTDDPRQIAIGQSQATWCAWILLAVLAGIGLLLVVAGVLMARWRRRAKRRREAREQRPPRGSAAYPGVPPGSGPPGTVPPGSVPPGSMPPGADPPGAGPNGSAQGSPTPGTAPAGLTYGAPPGVSYEPGLEPRQYREPGGP